MTPPVGLMVTTGLLGVLTACSLVTGIAIGPLAFIPLIGGAVATRGIYRKKRWARIVVLITSAIVVLVFIPMLVIFYLIRPYPEYFSQNFPWFICVASAFWFLHFLRRDDVKALFKEAT